MAEYIKRTDAVKIAEKYGLANGSVLGRHTGLADCIASEISCLPAANVAPVVHGRWETNSDRMVRRGMQEAGQINILHIGWKSPSRRKENENG